MQKQNVKNRRRNWAKQLCQKILQKIVLEDSDILTDHQKSDPNCQLGCKIGIKRREKSKLVSQLPQSRSFLDFIS